MSMQGHYLYWRKNSEPIQATLVWDAERFLKARMEEGRDAEVPFVISVESKEEYMQERRR